MNNDNALRDPTTANCRIYVGNLKENTPKIELQNIFSKYGNIRGVMVSRNFGFIQFDDESNANKAIESENQKLYNGRKIMVSKAKKNNQKQPDKGNNSGGGANNDNNTNQIAQNNSMLNASASEPNVNLSQQNNSNAPNNNSGNNNNNNNNPTNMGNVSQMQNTGNHQPRQQWRNRNNNRNNNNNEMNLNTDRERSPFDGRKQQIDDGFFGQICQQIFNNFSFEFQAVIRTMIAGIRIIKAIQTSIVSATTTITITIIGIIL